ncbi:MAG: chemotaxis protein CheX [Anaerofustis sp.]
MTEHSIVQHFVEAIKSIFASVSDKPIPNLTVVKTSGNTRGNDLLVVIGLVGDISGNFYMSMDSQTSNDIAKALMGGMEIEEGLNDLVTSAISELGNMISGNACIGISSMNLEVDITPPTVIIGDQISFSTQGNIYSIPIELENLGAVHFDLAIKTA